MANVGQRFGDDARVVLCEPVLEVRVRHLYGQQRPVLRNEARRLEPGVEAVAVDFRLDVRQQLIPEIHVPLRASNRDGNDLGPPLGT